MENTQNLPPTTVPRKKVPMKVVFVLVVALLALLATGFIGYLNRDFISNALSGRPTAPQPVAVAQVVNPVDVEPVNEIKSFIKPCLFSFLNACAEPITEPNTSETETVDPNKNVGPEAAAANDVNYAIGATSNGGLKDYNVSLDAAAVANLFPEYNLDASSSAVNIVAPAVIARVADKYNINQRVLVTLMEVMNTGAGPLMSGSSEYSRPFFANNDGFLTQLIQTAEQLQANKVKYDLIVQDKGQLPSTVTFLDKNYTVGSSANAETLAIADFIANGVQDKKSFEKAIAVTAPTDSSKQILYPNFYSIYKQIYKADPR